MEIITEKVVVTTTGDDGSATGSTVSGAMTGYLLDIYLDFHASCPATADTTVSYTTRGGNILVVTDSATDAFHAPLKQASSNAAAALTGIYQPYVLNDSVTVSVAGANALTACVTAYLRYVRV